MMKRLNIVVTAGGVTERIDSIRKITNSSSGKLGIMIAEELAKKYPNSKITIIGSKQAFNVIPSLPVDSKLITIESTADLEREVKDALVSEHVDIFIHSMAVADYTTDTVIDFDKFTELIESGSAVNEALKDAAIDASSKMPSSLNMMIKMKKTPKIIKMIKELSPRTFLVGFKLLNDVPEEHLFDVGFDLLRKNKCNLVVANDLANIRNGNHRALIVYPEKSYDTVEGKNKIASKLVETINKRAFVGHPKSVRVGINNLTDKDKEVSHSFVEMMETGYRLYQKGYLPEVINHDRTDVIGTYGNMSTRLSDNRILITSRNVHKGKLSPTDVSLIHNVDENIENADAKDNVYAKVYYSSDLKPSIDTAIHAKIYEITKANAIIHIHTDKIFLGYPYINEQFPCGSMEECDAIIAAIERVHATVNDPEYTHVVQMKKHGLIIAGKDLKDCEAKLNELFERTPYINSSLICVDKEALDHIKEVRANFTKEGLLYNLELAGETIGCIWEKHTFGLVRFGIFTKSNCGKGLNIVKKYLELYDKDYQLYTTPKCNIADFYEKKYGFVKCDSNENLITLFRTKTR